MGERYHRPDGKFAYRGTEKEKLLNLVTLVANELQRPVCAYDIRRHLKSLPQEQPLLLQALGQQLFKAARPEGTRRLHRMGLIGNQAFYAATDESCWRPWFHSYSATLALRRELKIEFPKQAQNLLSTTHEPLARNALAGWVLEVFRLKAQRPQLSFSQQQALHQLIALAKANKADQFAAIEPSDLISGKEAKEIILQEMHTRVPWRLEYPETRPNLNRYLAGYAWPQIGLFARRETKLYWSKQIQAACAARWPLRHEPDPSVGDAVSQCLRFGEFSQGTSH